MQQFIQTEPVPLTHIAQVMSELSKEFVVHHLVSCAVTVQNGIAQPQPIPAVIMVMTKKSEFKPQIMPLGETV